MPRQRNQPPAMETRVSMAAGYEVDVDQLGDDSGVVYPAGPVVRQPTQHPAAVLAVRVLTKPLDVCWYCQRGLCTQWLVYELLSSYVLHGASGSD